MLYHPVDIILHPLLSIFKNTITNHNQSITAWSLHAYHVHAWTKYFSSFLRCVCWRVGVVEGLLTYWHPPLPSFDHRKFLVKSQEVDNRVKSWVNANHSIIILVQIHRYIKGVSFIILCTHSYPYFLTCIQ